MRKNLIFSEEEFQRRIRKTKEMMDKGGMEMLLVMDPANHCFPGCEVPTLVRQGAGFQRGKAYKLAAG